MDRRMIEAHLEQAERHVAQGESHVARQRKLIQDLQRDNHDTAMARELLSSFQRTLSAQIDHMDRLRGWLEIGMVDESVPVVRAD
jgi:hypothetical protein